MRKISLFLALIMLVSMAAIPAGAEQETLQQPVVKTTTKKIIEVDGYQFRDLNDNGTLDVYEDWRADIEDRITDLLSQMTIEEEVGLLFHANSGGTFSPLYPKTEEWMYSHEPEIEVNGARYIPMWYMITEDHVNHYLDNNTGTPQEQIEYHNALQQIAEETRLGIPVTFSCDREYNTWGSMVNMAYAAFGYAHDKELMETLVSIYAREMKAIGYQMVLHPYGVELGSWYGEEPTAIADMIAAEVAAIETNGIDSCTKHFIARGGRSSFEAARPEAQMVDNWMVPWQAAIDAGTDWIMINEGAGLSNDVWVQFDKPTMDYLRNDLGYEGVILSDWPIILGGVNRGTVGGDKDYSNLSVGECYVMMLSYGMDQFGEDTIAHGTDTTISTNDPSANWPDTLLEQIELGKCDMELIHTAARRVLRAKFRLGLFENPYSDVDEAMKLIANDRYILEQFALQTTDDIYAARKEETNELEIRLQTESTVLLKNDNGLLPLAEGTKVFVTGSSEKTAALDAEAFGAHFTVTASPAEADVVVARVTAWDDTTETIADDAKEAGKPLVLVADTAEPSTWAAENCDALLFATYNCATDHGSSYGDFFTHVLPSVLADMLAGEKVPGGRLVVEIARTPEDALLDWGDLHFDTAMSTRERLYLMQLVKNNPTVALPNNVGDVLFTSNYGMSYDQPADITANTLVLPAVAREEEREVRGVMTTVLVKTRPEFKVGEPVEISFVLTNNGGAGSVTCELTDNGEVAATRFMALEAGQFRVATMTWVPQTAGEHTLNVCGLETVVTVAE